MLEDWFGDSKFNIFDMTLDINNVEFF